MPPTTLEFDVPSTAQAVGRYNQWISTKTVRVRRTGRPKYARFVRLSRFDLAVNEGLDRLASLERNWDAEGADPIEPAIIGAARELISALPRHLKRPLLIPAVVPMCKGNLQFEWSKGQRCLELELETPNTIRYLKWHPEDGIEEEDSFDIDDTGQATTLLRWIAEEPANV